jgi:hypothetical protein
MVHHRSNYYRSKENVTRLYRRPGKLIREYETHLINPPLSVIVPKFRNKDSLELNYFDDDHVEPK